MVGFTLGTAYASGASDRSSKKTFSCLAAIAGKRHAQVADDRADAGHRDIGVAHRLGGRHFLGPLAKLARAGQGGRAGELRSDAAFPVNASWLERSLAESGRAA